MPTDTRGSWVSQSSPTRSAASSWIPGFRRDGYAHFRQLIPLTHVESARSKILNDVQERFDPARLVEYNNRSWCPDVRKSREIERLFKYKAVQAITDEALGKKRYGYGSGQIAIRQARSASQASEPIPHIDGIPTRDNGVPGTEIQSFTALVGIFLTEVKTTFAGNFSVWPGSHMVLEQYFRERGEPALREGMPQIPLGSPVQLLCQPGDMVLCHYQLAHAASVNTSDQDRIAVFFRLSFKGLDGPGRGQERWHHLTDAWSGWQI